MRARAVIGSILLVVSAPLAACGEEEDSTKAGDIIKARLDNQFKDGEGSTVVLPTGRLLIHSARPVESAGDDETRTREKVDAPAGAVLVPISWQYDPWDKGRLDGIFDTNDTPNIDLVSGDQRYRLPPPESDSDAGESFYVVIDGDGKDRSLEIDFDGVVQSVDLASGSLDEGEAKALYDIEDKQLKAKVCDDAGNWFDGERVTAEFGCEITGPVLTPYAAGKWAPEGTLFLALTLSTELRAYTESDGLGDAARYAARSVTVKPEIDGVKPVSEVPNEDGTDGCPIPASAVCGWSRHLIYEVPADDGEQGPLTAKVSYRLVLGAAFGDWDPPARTKVEAEEQIKLWDD